MGISVFGPLVGLVDTFESELADRGYWPSSIEAVVAVLRDLSRWLEREGLEPGELTPARRAEFAAARRAAGRRRFVREERLAVVMEFLCGQGVAPSFQPPAVVSPLDALLADYRAWMVAERGLSVKTAGRYEATARRLLSARPFVGAQGVEGLTAAEVTQFLVRECARVGRGSAKGKPTELRSLLRFLHLRGLTPVPLAGAVPGVAGWHGTGLPAVPRRAEVAAMMAGCDRSVAIGRRDYAILVLLTRLGLRAGEVARLTLEDVDWRAGELVVRGKSRRDERLPLPVDVGEALADYLDAGRPPVACREMFIRGRAPARGHRRAVDQFRGAPCVLAGRGGAGRRAPAPSRGGGRDAAQWSGVGRDRPGAAAPGPGHDGHVRQGRSRRAGAGRQAVAAGGVMSAFADHAQQYLSLRRALGHKLDEAHRLLPRYVAYLDAGGAETVTVALALGWATEPPGGGPPSTVWGRRMAVTRGFRPPSQRLRSAAPRCLPGAARPPTTRRAVPYLYSDAEIAALMCGRPAAALARCGPPTYETLIGLLAATGMRSARRSVSTATTSTGRRVADDRAATRSSASRGAPAASRPPSARAGPLTPSSVTVRCPAATGRPSSSPPPAPGSSTTTTTTPSARLLRRPASAGPSRRAPAAHDCGTASRSHPASSWYRAGVDVAGADAAAVHLPRARRPDRDVLVLVGRPRAAGAWPPQRLERPEEGRP